MLGERAVIDSNNPRLNFPCEIRYSSWSCSQRVLTVRESVDARKLDHVLGKVTKPCYYLAKYSTQIGEINVLTRVREEA